MLKDVAREYMDDWKPGVPSKYNCAEVMLRSMNDYYELKINEDELKMATGFGGGMKVGSVCGILTGAIMGLSVMFKDDNPESKAKLGQKTMQIMNGFKSKYESDRCFDVLENGCIQMILYTSDLIEEVLSR